MDFLPIRVPMGASCRPAKTGLLACAVLLAAWLVGCTGEPQADSANSAQIQAGKALYGTYCAVCHGAELQGQEDWKSRSQAGKLPAPPHDASGHTWHHDDETLLNITMFGLEKYAGPDYKTDMPKYAGVLSNQQALSVLAYIKSTWPAEVQARQASINRK